MSLAKFGVEHPVPVNLLMFALLIAGAVAGLTLTREFFPETTPEMATVSLPYPGATPEEVEEALALKVEDALAELDEVERLTTTVAEGGGGIVVEFRDGVDIDDAVEEVQRAVDRLQDLPEEAETITVTEFEPKLPVIMLTLYGEVEEETLKQAIRRVRDELKSLPDMGEVVVSGVRDYEIRVDVSEDALIEYGVGLPRIAEAVGAWLREVPGGTVRTEEGTISVRTLGTPETARAIRHIPLIALPSGAVLRVGDVAVVRDAYVDADLVTRFNGERSVSLTVFKTGDQDAVLIAEMVRAYAAGRRGEPYPGSRFDKDRAAPRWQAYRLGLTSPYPLPMSVATHSDLARFIEGRLDLLVRNARAGAVLVFLTLLFFLNWRTAFWVGMGLVTALAGTLLFMSLTGTTLNLLTMFGLIVVLGILVDDAIVVAENIQAEHERGVPALRSAVGGTRAVFWPVVATVLTTIVAFLPLRFVQGQVGDLIAALPNVVMIALLMSLVESVLILPSHVGHSLAKRDRRPNTTSWTRRLEAKRDALINDRIAPAFGRLLRLSLHFRYVSVAIALATLIVTLGMVAGGRVPYTFLTESDAETVVVDVRMPIGTPLARTDALVRRIELAAQAQPEVQSISAVVGQTTDIDTGATEAEAGHLAQVFLELVPVEARDRESSQVIASIRETLGPVDEAEDVSYQEIGAGFGGPAITFEITGEDEAELARVVNEVKASLAEFYGVFDIADDHYAGQRELQVHLKPGAAALGFTAESVALQVRGAIYGLEAHVFSARREDIDVRVRLDEDTRRSLANVENMWVISPAGRAVPLSEVADLREARAYSTIRRIDRRRAITVTADVAPDANPEAIVNALDPALDELRRAHPGISIEFGGRQRNQMEAFATLPVGFAAGLLMIYVILAWLFASYVQPIVVMLAIPFGVIGVIWGHLLLGYELTFLSMIGFVALAGIVVNDSLILVEFYNERRRDGLSVEDALVEAGVRRLRPIFLTTLTTVFGLTPLMLEQSFQAKFLIPMAIAIAFGLLGATILVLMVLPCIIVIVNDLRRALHFLWHGRPRPEITPTPPTVDPEPNP